MEIMNKDIIKQIPNIISGIRKYYPVSDKSILKLSNLFTEHHFPKHHLLTKAGTLDHNAYFIEKGCTRTYFNIVGKEVTNWFSREGDITFSSDSLYHKQPGLDFVEVLEDSVIYSIPIDYLDRLYEEDIEISNWSRIIHQEVLLRMQELRISRLSQSAKDRYEFFLSDYPDLINRVNLGYIASFLGMTQQHLSSIRA